MRASNKIRFIRAVINGELLLSNRKRADIEADLEAQGFDKMAKSKDVGGCVLTCAGVAALDEHVYNKISNGQLLFPLQASNTVKFNDNNSENNCQSAQPCLSSQAGCFCLHEL